MKAAVQNTHQYDLGIIVLGLLAFIFSLIPSYYTADVPGLLSDNLNAWHGFWGWFGAVLALAGAALLAAEVLMNMAMPMPTRLVVLVLFGLGLLCTIIAGLTWAGYDTHGVDVGKYTGHGFSYWACLILILAGTVLAFLRTEYAGAVTGKKR